MRLYDTRTRRKIDFAPAGDIVTLYVCGITTSGPSHLGHALSSITFEVLHRYLEYRGYRVRRVQNFTDIEDKIIARAPQEGLTTEQMAEKYIDAFFRDMDALNVRRADLYPRATEEVPEIIRVIEGLIGKGVAYESGGNVWFRVRSHPDYGRLTRRTVDEMLEGTRFDVEPGKEDPADFALWKASKPGELWWESPWGRGRPGWHIECTAMVLRHLGETIDIHGGGLDIIFPHHENEVAQSEAFTGKKPFARWWMHNGLLRLADEKMSKSIGNIVSIQEALTRHSPDAIRLWMYSSHYRSPVLYEDEGIAAQERALRRLRAALSAESHAGAGDALAAAPFREAFIEAMDDDLNAPRAVAVLFDLAREINRARDGGRDVAAAQSVLRELAGVLGLTLEAPAPSRAPDGALSDEEIESLLTRRAELRAGKRFSEADAIRAELESKGIAIADSPQGTTWSRG